MFAPHVIPGYQLNELIHEGVNTVIYRGISEPKQLPVIIKIIKKENPSLTSIARLKYEYNNAKALNFPGVVKVLGLETYENRSFLVFEDFGGISLKQLIATQKISITQFLTIAVQLAQIVAEVHRNHIIHKDIKPGNIIIHLESGVVKLTDFSIASIIDSELPQSTNTSLIEGTLAYMSPEQTGRMNRYLDYRSDFYSLGVTFYELLTGRLPFITNTDDALELIYCHIAKEPTPIRTLNNELPSAVAGIVAKLMGKNAEDRYQSAIGLQADLDYCLTQLKNTGTIPDFIPGERDITGQLFIPQKLYGREQEVTELLAAFERASQGKSEIILVSGYSGTGKSSLVNEIQKPVVRQRGYFISGKFDQYKTDIPYASLIQAFQSLIQQLLTENAQRLQTWRRKLIAALGNNGKLIIDVIPEVELIIGKQPEVVEVLYSESEKRFNRVFRDFIQVFTDREHPLVIFLDDLQWADAATLKLIKLLIGDPDSKYLFLVGAYRDSDINHSHILIKKLIEIQEAGAIIKQIEIQPLGLKHVQQFLNDTFICIEESQAFSELIFRQTEGNPFFLVQLLKTLYQEKILVYNFDINCWQWDYEGLIKIGISDLDIVELMVRNINKLPSETQNILKIAACIGSRFNLSLLSKTCSLGSLEVMNSLIHALKEGLILAINNENIISLFLNETEINSFDNSIIAYRFSHDRVQQAAYNLIPEAEKKNTHLQIGRLFLATTNPDDLEDNIFDIVNQINLGYSDSDKAAEKYALAKLNLIAGRKSKKTFAYDSAAKYLNKALYLLDNNSWTYDYELTLNIHNELAELEYLNGNYSISETICKIGISSATNNFLDTIKLHEIQIHNCIAREMLSTAIEMGLDILSKLNVTLLEIPPDVNNIETYYHLPRMSEPRLLAANRIMSILSYPTYIANPALYASLSFTIVQLSIEYGNSLVSPYGYTLYGLILCGVLKDIESGYRFGKLSIKLLNKLGANPLKAKVLYGYYGFIHIWKHHISKTIQPLNQIIQESLQSGDIETACLVTSGTTTHHLLCGTNLEILRSICSANINFINNLKQQNALDFQNLTYQLVLNLLQEYQNQTSLVGEVFDEVKMIPLLENSLKYSALAVLYINKLFLAFIFRDYSAALINVSLAQKYVFSLPASICYSQYIFYATLTLLDNYQKLEGIQKKQSLELLDAYQKQLKEWVHHAPMNFQHQYNLVKAQKARVLGNILEAMDLYDAAIQAADKNGFIHEKALACELAGEFYQSINKDLIARTYLTQAYYGYAHWGAMVKVKQLEKLYPYLTHRTQESTNFETTITSTTTSTSDFSLDITTVVKTAQALSKELITSRLLDKLLKLVQENAGAQQAFFIIRTGHKLIIESSLRGNEDEMTVLQKIPVEDSHLLPISLINYVERTQDYLVLDDASNSQQFNLDPYIAAYQPKSVLVLPIIYQCKLKGILYLENNLIKGAFNNSRLELLKIIAAQAAISLENAQFYNTLEQRVAQRTQELENTLEELHRTQVQMIQNEKMSSLGQLVAGIAHEINNPISFIYGNLTYTKEYIESLIGLIDVYTNSTPQLLPSFITKAEEIDLEYIREDIPKLLNSMQVGAARVRDIVQSLRNFSRLDEASIKSVDIHEGIESTLTILQQKLVGIRVIKKYTQLPKIYCYAAEINQVLMSLFTNSIDALSERQNREKLSIRIITELREDTIAIRVADNGIGMADEIVSKIFDPFFTTKAVGKGTGLGLAIAYQIIVDKHGGKLLCNSVPGKGTEFTILLPHH